MPAARGQSADHAHSEQVGKTSSSPVGLLLDTHWTLNAKALNSRRFLDRLRLEPRRHAEHQDFSQAPDMITESCHHRRCAWSPYLG